MENSANLPDWAKCVALPKWPQMLVVGETISVEQAKEIIRRTDTFLTCPWRFCGGNNEKWNNWAKNILGISDILALEKEASNNEDSKITWQMLDKVRENIGQKLHWISTEFVSNSWASNAYIFGPHGWCHPDGRIGFTDNIGKWPDVEDVFKDWCILAKEFPFLKLTATLFYGEQCEENSVPVITFLVENGKVSAHKPEEMMHRFDEFKFDIDRSDEALRAHMSDILNRPIFSSSLRSNEQGLPDEWIIEFGRISRPVIEEEIKSFLGSRK